MATEVGIWLTTQAKVMLLTLPLSAALTVTVYSLGVVKTVPEMTPVMGLMLSPGGRFAAEKLPASASWAWMARLTTAPSLLFCNPGLVNVGGVVSFTVQLKRMPAEWPLSLALILTL